MVLIKYKNTLQVVILFGILEIYSFCAPQYQMIHNPILVCFLPVGAPVFWYLVNSFINSISATFTFSATRFI